MSYTIINVVLVNVGWFACVLGAGNGVPWVGPAVVAVLAAVHVACRPPWRRGVVLMAAAAVFGYAIDSALVLLDVISFGPHARLGGPSPIWMVALWVNLATALDASLAWLQRRPMVAAVIGGVGGPLAYAAGARLDALTLGSDRVVSLASIGVAWLVAMPALAWLGRMTAKEAVS